MRRFLDRIGEGPGSRTGWLVLALLVAPLVARVGLIEDTAADPHWQDLRGVVSDGVIALVGAAIALAMAQPARVLALAWVALFVLVQFANYENVLELKSLASVFDLKFLASSTFVLGSATAVSRPVLLGVTLVTSLILAWRGLQAPFPRAVHWVGGAAVGLLLAHWIWPGVDRVAYWRQINVVQHNAAFLLWASHEATDRGRRFGDPPTAMLDLLPEIAADLSGEPVAPLEGRARNVILVALESVSGAMVAPIAAAHGYPPGDLLELPFLSQLARERRSFATFVAENRKTNRGMYALLCGEFPNLAPGTPKMTEHASAGWRRCLPEVLRNAGYRTVYLQGAPLSFMLKDRFMPRAGFERVYGHDFFKRAYARSYWGVDDRAMFEQSLDVIAELRKSDQPYFVTLLTVGSHHPFVFPPDFERRKTGAKRKAMRYADLAARELMAGLEKMGALDDTLVLLTSDESRGMETPHPLRKLRVMPSVDWLSQSWGYLIALDPADRSSDMVHEPYGLSDIALSIVDYLGLSEQGTHFFGRSIFRRYPKPRRVFFANTNVMHVGYVDETGGLVNCNVADRTCQKFATPKGLFGDTHVAREVEPGDDDVLELARRSVFRSSSDPQRRDYWLVANKVVHLDKTAAEVQHLVHGGQLVDVPPDQWIEVDIDVEARGKAGVVALRHYIRNSKSWRLDRFVKKKTFLRRNVRLSNGDRFRLRYTVSSNHSLQGIKCEMFAQPTRSVEWDLIFREARMSVRWGGDRPAPGTHVVFAEVIKAGSRRTETVGEAPKPR